MIKWVDLPHPDVPDEDKIVWCIRYLGDNDGHYNALRYLIKYWKNAFLHFIIGGRGIGKTDYWIQIASLLYQVFGKKTVWIRHKQNELSDEGNYMSFLNDAHHFGWVPDSWICKEDGVYSDKDGDKVIEFASLNTFSNKRGGGHPDTLLMVIDEIIPEDGRYHPNAKLCVKGLLSLCETFTRGRPGSCMVACSNFVRADNPYFAKFKIYPDWKYHVTTFPDKAINIEVPRGFKVANKEDSQLSKLKRAGGMGNYNDGQDDPMLTLIKSPPKGSKPIPYVVKIDGSVYREYTLKGRVYWTEHHGQIPNGVMVMCPGLDDIDEDAVLLPKMFYKIQSGNIEENLIRFDSVNTMHTVLNMIYESA